MPSRTLNLGLGLAVSLALTACSSWRVDQMPQVAAGFASHLLCDDVFVTGIDPELAYAERVRPMPGMGLVDWATRRRIDPERQEVTVSIGGLAVSHARHRPGLGCVAISGEGGTDPSPAPLPGQQAGLPLPPDPFGDTARAPDGSRLSAVLDQALVDVPGQAQHRTKALVVLQAGRLVAERYAPGYGVNTPVLGFSTSKTFTNALVGILVQQGRLTLDQPAPLPAWADPADPRHAITVEHLLRQTPGLDVLQDNSGADLNARIMYVEHDKVARSTAVPLVAPPGTRWAYTDVNYLLLSRLVRDAVGGDAAAVNRFMRLELFGPVGMRHAALDFDASGTGIGSSHLSASARDWARLGQLFLDDGVVGGRRILPAGWVAMSTTPTLNTGYGAGLWTNRVPGLVPGWGVPWGLSKAPADAYFARGFMGQFVVVVPSRQLVLVRLSVSHERGDDIGETNRLIGEVLDALGPNTAGRAGVAVPASGG